MGSLCKQLSALANAFSVSIATSPAQSRGKPQVSDKQKAPAKRSHRRRSKEFCDSVKLIADGESERSGLQKATG
jgi:hypothetical protein